MTTDATTAGTVRMRAHSTLFLVTFLPIFALYFVTANKDLPYHIDAVTNVYSAWAIGTTGTPILREHTVLTEPGYLATYGWVIDSRRGPVSQYPPGSALLAAPLYAAFARGANDVTLVAENATTAPPVILPVPSLVPAAVAAAGAAAAAVSLLGLALRELGLPKGPTLAALMVFGFGTGLWSVGADALWQHGPASFWVALAVWLSLRQRWFGAGLAFAALSMTRLPVIAVGLTIGLSLLATRQFSAAWRLAVGTAPGVALLVAYNTWLFGSPSLTGGYGSSFTERAASADVAGYASNIVSALFDSQHGLLVWSPFIAIALFGLAIHTTAIPRTATIAAIGGVAYLLIQLKANRASGGDGFSYYRYPIEAIMATAPCLTLAGLRLWAAGTIPRLALSATCLFAIGAHAVAAV